MTNTGIMGQVCNNTNPERDSAAVRERPILFSSSMVRAILDGRKTVTRRIVKPQPESHEEIRLAADAPGRPDADWFLVKHDALNTWAPLRCPYGAPGDRLWVRETWHTASDLNKLSPAEIGSHALEAGYSKPWAPIRYVADGASRNEDTIRDFGGWSARLRPAIHMPRWASRITLEVTAVRVERLHAITDDDARAEGVEPYTPPHGHLSPEQRVPGPGFDRCRVGDQPHRLPFADLWDRINGKRAPWASNPWLWCISFRRVEAR